MGADEFHPGDSRPVLHFHHQAVLVAADVEPYAIVPADAGVAELLLHRLRRGPGGFHGFFVPAFERTLRIAAAGPFPELLQRALGDHPHQPLPIWEKCTIGLGFDEEVSSNLRHGEAAVVAYDFDISFEMQGKSVRLGGGGPVFVLPWLIPGMDDRHADGGQFRPPGRILQFQKLTFWIVRR